MARTVHSVSNRGEKRKGGGETGGRDNVVEGTMVEEVGEVMGDGRVEERGDVEGRVKRKRKGSIPFQFDSNHTLYSQTTAKCKQKTVTVEKNRDKRAKFYKKKHFSDLKKEVKALKSVVKKQAAQIQAKMKKIKSLKSKN